MTEPTVTQTATGPDTSSAPAANDATSAAPPKKSSPDALTEFFRTSNAARIAAGSLKKAAEVGVHFTDAPGDYRFTTESGAPLLLQGPAKDPDFELTFGPGASRALAERPDADVGDLGILFFQHMLAHDPESKIKVKLHSGLLKLTLRGYLGVLAAGGSKVFGWLATKGLKGPGAVGAALSKLKKG